MKVAFWKCINICSNCNCRTCSVANIDITLNTTNPDSESNEYIDSNRWDVELFGWNEERARFSSNNFQTLHNLAIQLTKKGLAYVCDMSKAKMKIHREMAMKEVATCSLEQDPDIKAQVSSSKILPSCNPDTPVERNHT